MELHFIRPYWLLAFIPLVYIFLQLKKFNRNNNWRSVCDPHLLAHLIVDPDRSKQFSPLLWLGLAWFFATLALSGPSFMREKQNIYRLADSRMIVMSLSPSMYNNDGATTRIMRARFKIIDLLNSMQEGQTGLVVYAGEGHTVVPLTEDNNTIKNLVPILDPSLMPVAGDDLVAGVQEAENLFQQAKSTQGQIILLADKIGNSENTKTMVQSLLKNNIRLYILDLSSNKTESQALANLAEATGGLSVKVTPTNQDVQQIIKNITSKGLAEVNDDKKLQAATLWKDQGIWFAFLVVPFALLAFRRGYLA